MIANETTLHTDINYQVRHEQSAKHIVSYRNLLQQIFYSSFLCCTVTPPFHIR